MSVWKSVFLIRQAQFDKLVVNAKYLTQKQNEDVLTALHSGEHGVVIELTPKQRGGFLQTLLTSIGVPMFRSGVLLMSTPPVNSSGSDNIADIDKNSEIKQLNELPALSEEMETVMENSEIKQLNELPALSEEMETVMENDTHWREFDESLEKKLQNIGQVIEKLTNDIKLIQKYRTRIKDRRLDGLARFRSAVDYFQKLKA